MKKILICFVALLSSCNEFNAKDSSSYKLEVLENKISTLEQSVAQMKKQYDAIYSLNNKNSIDISDLKKSDAFSTINTRSEILFDKFPIYTDSQDKDYKFAITSLETDQFNDAKYSIEFIIDRYLKKYDTAKKDKKLPSVAIDKSAVDLYNYALYMYGYIAYNQKEYSDAIKTFEYMTNNLKGVAFRKEVLLGLLFTYDKLSQVKNGCDIMNKILDEFKQNPDTIVQFKQKFRTLHFNCN